MLPKVILHNSITIDGSLTGFEPEMGLHYQIAGSYRPDVHLIGSNTIRSGIEMFGGTVPPEEPCDCVKPERDKSLPAWVIIDSQGSLQGMLHTCRRFEYCRDVILLVSEKTPETYLEHLRERNYAVHICGRDKVDLPAALELLTEKYDVKTILTDTGRILGNLLLNQGLVSEISLLVHPVILGVKSYDMFREVTRELKLELVKNEILEGKYIQMVYKVND